MNNLEFQKVVDEQLASFIMMTLLIEIGQKIDFTSDENSYVKNLCHLLGISKDRLNKLQTLVFDNDIQILDKATSFNFDTFFSQIHERFKYQFGQHKAINITLVIHKYMVCEEYYSETKLKSNILNINTTDGVVLKKSLKNEMKISQIIKSTKDEEFRDLLVEVTEKDWAAELEDFKDKVINIKVDDLVSKDINTNQEEGLKRGSYIGGLLFATIGLFISKDLILLASLIAMIGVCMVSVILMGGVGAVVAAVLGIVGMTVYSMLLMPLIASGNILISKTVGVIACTAIGSIVGAGLGVKFLRYKLQQKKSELEKPYRESLSSYVLMPDDLLRFWESRVEIFLRERKSRVQSRIREASRTKAECIKIIEELKELKKTHDPTTENKLLYQVKNMAAVVEEAQKVNAILQKLEDKFAAKIEELRVLVTKQKKYERDQYRLQEIEGKVKRIIGKSQEIKDDWGEEKSKLQIQIQGMMNAFQSQLLHTKDFIRAEITLSNHSESEIVKELDNSL